MPMDPDFRELMNDEVYVLRQNGRSAFGTTTHDNARGPFRVRHEHEPRMSRTQDMEDEFGTDMVVFCGNPEVTTEDRIRFSDGREEKVVRVFTLYEGGRAHHTEVFLSGAVGPQ